MSSINASSSSKRTLTQATLFSYATVAAVPKRLAVSTTDEVNKPVTLTRPQYLDLPKDPRSLAIAEAIRLGDVKKMLGTKTRRVGWCTLSELAPQTGGYVQISWKGANKVNNL